MTPVFNRSQGGTSCTASHNARNIWSCVVVHGREPSSIETKLFNKSLSLGKLPSEWKEGRISAIFKKGSRKKAGNYRPISLTSIVSKTMEHCVRNHIVNHMMVNNLFSSQQYGFVKGRSTVLQLLNVMDVWTNAIDKGDSIDNVYIDFTNKRS